MPRNGQVAVQHHGSLDAHRHHQHSNDTTNTPTQRRDITPEIFRRFMSYEHTMLINHSLVSNHLGATIPMIGLDLPDRTNPLSLAKHSHDTFRRPVRNMPKRALAAVIPSSASRSTLGIREQGATARIVGSPIDTNRPQSAALASPQPVSKQIADESKSSPLVAQSQTLSQCLEQLHVSPPSDLRTPSVNERRVTEAVQGDHSYPASAESTFRFDSLPSKLTDDGFHYRQRAAQFILLCSQEASPEHLSKLNRLSMPLSRRSSTSSKPGNHSRRDVSTNAADPFAWNDHDRSAILDCDESIHSRNNTYNASDDESEYLDFEACRTAHLCNKKKRKSSRYSSPGLPVPDSMSSVDKSPRYSTTELPPQVPSNGTPRGLDRALIDRTNTFQQTAPQARNDHSDKQGEDFPGFAELSSFAHASFVRLPPRQTSDAHYKSALRSRIRARLAHTFHQRKLARLEREARAMQDQQIRREVQEKQNQVEAEAQPPLSPERRLPPKRTLKAGKRAQAIRGGNSSAKPLTIAEIRARAAAAASGGGGQSSPSSSVKLNRSPSPARLGPADPAQRAKSSSYADRADRREVSTKHEALSSDLARLQHEHGTSASSSRADEVASALSTHQEEEKASARMVTPPQHKLVVPSASFDFRMSSSVALRLRELRAQLDAASRNLSDTGAAPAPTAGPVRPSDSLRLESTKYDHGPPGGALPWVRSTLTPEQQLGQPQQTTATVHSKAENKIPPPRNSAAPLSEPRSGSCTAQKHQSPSTSQKAGSASPTRSKSTAANNGRRSTTNVRKSGDAKHKHGSACKHGHVNSRGHATGSGSNLFTEDDWICVFCEYELYYGETPLMLRACRNRKKLVEKKGRVKTKVNAVVQQKKGCKSSRANWEGCHHQDHGHDHDHDHDHGYNGCQHGHGHEYGCRDERGSCCETCDNHQHEQHNHLNEHGGKQTSYRQTRDSKTYSNQDQEQEQEQEQDSHRERCDCGNSIHSSDFTDDDSKPSTHL